MASPYPSTQLPSTPAPSTKNRARAATGTSTKRNRKGKAGTISEASPRLSQEPGSRMSQTPTPTVQWQDQLSAAAGPSTAANQLAEALNEVAQGDASTSAQGLALRAGTNEGSVPPGNSGARLVGGEEEGDGEDEALPAMAEDDYSAQLTWQSQSKDNLKYVRVILDVIRLLSMTIRVLMDNFSPAQYDRFEAYRRHALPKQAVRKVQ
jgi:transcription initiation factor TFIID subunit 11